MKIFFTINISILFLFISYKSFTQTLPSIEFQNLQENWMYISKDSNFIKSDYDKYSTPYWGRYPVLHLQNNSDLYILERVTSQSPYTGPEGSLLHSLNHTTGELNWIHHNNTYVGNKHREYYSTGDLRVLPDGNIELLGLRAIDSIDYTIFEFYFLGNPISRIIDVDTGLNLETNTGTDTLKEYYKTTGGFTRTWFLSEEEYLHTSVNVYNEDDFLKNSIDFFTLDDHLNIDTPFTQSIEHNTNIINGLPSFTFIPSSMRLSSDTIIVWFGTKNPSDPQNSPTELIMLWVDISDLNDIKVVKTMDVLENVYFPQSNFPRNINRYIKDENIFMWQLIETNEAPIPSNEFLWFAWYDQFGNSMSKIDYLQTEDNYYGDINIIGVRDGILYLIGSYRDNGVVKHDVLKIEPNTNEPIKLGELHEVNNQEHFVILAEFLPDNNILIGVKVLYYLENNEESEYLNYFSFKEDDLGILTNTKSVPVSELQLQLSPVPVSETLNISFPQTFTGYVEIIDLKGGLLKHLKVYHANELEIETSNYVNGMYFLKCYDEQNILVNNEKFIVNK